MADEDLLARIHQPTDEERWLEETQVGEPLSDPQLARLHEVECTLDQLWDLMRQRRALRDAGNDPSLAAERPRGTVEGYRQ
jgi:uncharacterized protein YjaG (DUF416 family)